MTTATRDIKTIVKLLKKASDAYYNGVPFMDDAEFDSLKDDLVRLDPNNAFLKQVGAPIKLSAWPKRKHSNFMGSQSKVNENHEYTHWRKRLNSRRVSISHKLDGSTLVLTYDKGVLQHAVTRGDGETGEEITPNALKMQNVKEKLPIPFTGDLRGEVILTLDRFDKHFKPKGYKNARNAANGKARDIKDTEDLVKHLKVIYFDVFSKTFIKTEELKQKLVRKMGLEYVDSAYMDADKVWAFFEAFDRDALPYLIDGLVVKIDDITEQNTLGATSGCPNGQVAIKFKSKTTETVVDDITWQVGLSGRITPVAELDPADLDGVTISRATLNNLDYITSLGLEIGDTILLARANDVIPRILRVTKKSNSGKGIKKPKKCPKCGDILEKDGAYIICVNSECAGAVFGDIMTWIKIHNMLGFGQRVVAGLIEEGLKDPADLYTASDYVLSTAAGSQKVGVKLKAMIDKTKEVTLDKFLAGLNIPHLGKTNSKRLKKKFEHLQNVLDATEDELANIQGIKTTAGVLHKGLDGKTKLIAKLLKHVTIKQDSGPLKGFSFAMTGLRNHNGQDLGTLIEDNGGELKSGVSKELDYLIIKDPNSTSAKAEKARKYGTKLISPDDFMAMI